MRIPDNTKSLDAWDLAIITHLLFNKVVTPAKIKNIAINTQCSLQGNGVDTERNSAVLEEVEQKMFLITS